MDIHYYFHLDLDPALAWVGVADHVVWYFRPGDDAPAPWTDPGKRPADATAAVVASPHKTFAAGTYIDALSLDPTKDPVPPPPPPPFYSDLVAYRQQPEVALFFQSSGRTHALA